MWAALSSQDAGSALEAGRLGCPRKIQGALEAGRLVEWQISTIGLVPKWEATVITAQLKMERGSMCMSHRGYLSDFRKF